MRDSSVRVVWLWLVCASLWAAPAVGRVLDRIAAVVNEEVILISEVEQRCGPALDDIPAALPLDQAVKRKAEIRRRTLDELIDERLVLQQVREAHIEVGDEEVERSLAQLRELNHMTAEQFEAALKAENKTLAEFSQELRGQIERDKLMGREIQGKLKVSEADVQEYYRTHYTGSAAREKVRASHILFALPPGSTPEQEAAVRQRAERVLGELRSGADFADIARRESDDPSASLGGDLGWFRRGDFVAAFEQVAFGLKAGQLSDLVRTRFGYHIILVTERGNEGPPSLDSVSAEIRSRLLREARDRAVRAWLDDVRRRSYIEIKL